MRRYTEAGERELQEVICNKCGKKLFVERGILKEEGISVDIIFRYFSIRDGMRHRFDLCGECYENWIRTFQVPVTEEEETELL